MKKAAKTNCIKGMLRLREVMSAFKTHRVRILMREGIVTLSGVVDSEVKRFVLSEVAGELYGVKKIVNSIGVRTAGEKRVVAGGSTHPYSGAEGAGKQKTSTLTIK